MAASRAQIGSEFRVGQMVVFPAHGLGKITGRRSEMVAGYKLDMLSIDFFDPKMTLLVPVNKVSSCGIRATSTADTMKAALEKLKMPPKVGRGPWLKRARVLEAKVNSGNPIEVAEVIRDLRPKSDDQERSYAEKVIYERALERLTRELAAVEKIDRVTASKKVEKLLKAA